MVVAGRSQKRRVTFYGIQLALATCTTVLTVLPVYEIFVRPHFAASFAHMAAPPSPDVMAHLPPPPPTVNVPHAQPAATPAPTPAPASEAAPAPAPAQAPALVPAPTPSPALAAMPTPEPAYRPVRLISLCPGQPKVADPQAIPERIRPLTLVHIPRTGGTTIEDCTKDEVDDVNRWGTLNAVLHNGGKRTFMNEKAKCFGQHVPTSAHKHYASKRTFCVVRDPYTRLISIFGYRNKMFNPQTGDCTESNLNERIQEWLKQFKGIGKRPMPYLHDCHMLPQAAWVYGWDVDKSEVKSEAKSCTHVLRFEGLKAGFNALMEAHDYVYRLSDVKKNPSDNMCARFTKADLWPKTQELIELVYKEDFELLGFTHIKRDTTSSPPQRLRRDPLGSRVSLCPGQGWKPQATASYLRPIEFIHIPRTGGTTIEHCTNKETEGDYMWGSNNAKLHGKERTYLNKRGSRCWGQHAPPNTIKFYAGKDTFCIVRNPYNRMISEFGHQQAMYSHTFGNCTVENMNRRLIEWMSEWKNGAGGRRPETYLHDCHMLPQAAYTHGWDTVTEKVIKDGASCTRMLRYESYATEFNALMEERGYPYRLTTHKLQGSGKACAAFKPKDLWNKTKQMLQEVYRIDFELLGYPMDID